MIFLMNKLMNGCVNFLKTGKPVKIKCVIKSSDAMHSQLWFHIYIS